VREKGKKKTKGETELSGEKGQNAKKTHREPD